MFIQSFAREVWYEMVKVADEVWIATALLHREHPDRDSFRVHEIVARADQEGLHQPRRPGVQVHAALHSVANKPPNPATYRMLVETPDGGRRLYRSGDPAHPARTGKVTPRREDLPAGYAHLLDWYESEYDLPAEVAAGEHASAAEEVYTPLRAASREIREAAVDYGWRERIALDPAVLVGKPVIRGTRLAVEFIVELLANGWRTEDILRNYPGITHKDIAACLRYAAESLRHETLHPAPVA